MLGTGRGKIAVTAMRTAAFTSVSGVHTPLLHRPLERTEKTWMSVPWIPFRPYGKVVTVPL